MVSHCHWNQKLIRDPNSSAADWEPLSDPSPPPPPPPPPLHSLHPLSLSLSLSLSLQDVWTGYLSARPGLGKAIATASASWCRSTAPPAVISVTVRRGSRKQQRSRGRKKKEKKNRKKVFSQLSSARSRCEPFANGATGANRSSQAEQRWVFSAICCGGEITLATGGVCVCRSRGYQHPRGGSVCFGSEFRPSRPGTCRLLAVSTPSIDSTSANWQLGPL